MKEGLKIPSGSSKEVPEGSGKRGPSAKKGLEREPGMR